MTRAHILGWIALAALAMGASACSSDRFEGAGSQTNWLACEAGPDCPEGSPCVCGYCAAVCTSRSDCVGDEMGDVCAAVDGLPAICSPGATSDALRVCTRSCVTSDDCPADATCNGDTCVLAPPALAQATLQTVLTADNAYALGYGSVDGLTRLFAAQFAILAEEINYCDGGPERYEIPVSDLRSGDYLYLIAWADASTTQGVLGQFSLDGQMVYTGDARFQVCATGENYAPASGGPSADVIERHLALCNAGSTDPLRTSAGWVDQGGNGIGALAIGETNESERPVAIAGNEFALVCNIDGPARWMWFNWAPDTLMAPTQSPFLWPAGATTADNPDKQFLIFRLPVSALFTPETSL